MLGLEESYERILEYFEEQKRGLPKKTVKKVIEEPKKPVIEKPSISDFTELKGPSYQQISKSTSKGFDIRKFELMMRSKLIEEYKISQSYERPYISVGELYNCMRQNYYSRMKYQVDVGELFKFSYLYLIQHVGKEVHSFFQELYNFTEVEKTVVSESHKVKGRTDAIKENNLFEIKTFDGKGGVKKSHEEKDYDQASVYAYILNKEYDYKIDNINIIYVPRDLKKIFAFDLKPDDVRAKRLLDRAPILLKHLSSHTVPDPMGATKEHCRYCLYKGYCSKDAFNKIPPPFVDTDQLPKEDKVAFLL